MEWAKYFAWPTALVVTAFLFFIIFRKPISSWIGTVKSVGKNGIQAGPLQLQQTAETKQPAEELMRAFDSLVLREQEDLIEKDLERRGLSDQNEIIKVLIRHLAVAALALRFEYIDKIIFGSQIRFLQYLNSQQGISIDVARSFYDYAAQQYPDIYKNYSFEKYLEFLSFYPLITKKGDLYFITNLGRDFLMYLIREGRPLVRIA